jgi:hypothetical protein
MCAGWTRRFQVVLCVYFTEFTGSHFFTALGITKDMAAQGVYLLLWTRSDHGL